MGVSLLTTTDRFQGVALNQRIWVLAVSHGQWCSKPIQGAGALILGLNNYLLYYSSGVPVKGVYKGYYRGLVLGPK